MKATKAKKLFKKRFGQANHLLITALVGLDAIESGAIKEKPESFSTSWSPRSPASSAARSRIFILESFLGWAIESLEMYLTELNRKPKELVSEKFTELYSRAGRSIYKKSIYVGEEALVDPLLIALIEGLITWRNYIFHYDVDNEIRYESKKLLEVESNRVAEEFCGLEVNQLTQLWEKGREPTFKEAASLISAVHKYVNAVDAYALENINLEDYCTSAVEKHLKENSRSIQKLKSLPQDKRKRYIKILIENIVGDGEQDEEILKRVIQNVESKHITNRSTRPPTSAGEL